MIIINEKNRTAQWINKSYKEPNENISNKKILDF